MKEEIPDGVELYDLGDHAAMGKRVFEKVKDAYSSAFPMERNGVRLELSDLDYVGPENVSRSEEKAAILGDGYLARRLRGTFSLKDVGTGELLDQKELSLTRVPYISSRGTIIHGGNDYAGYTQSRLLPGVFCRRQQNGDLMAHFNPKVGTGREFKMVMDPATAQYRLRMGDTNMHLYSLLHDMGVPDEHLVQSWGSQVLDTNKKKYDPRQTERAYEKMVRKSEQSPDHDLAQKAQKVQEALDKMRVKREVVSVTLPGLLPGSKEASAYYQRIAEAGPTPEFDPDLLPAEATSVAYALPWEKAAAAEDFEPELSVRDLKEEINSLHGKAGPRLAGMKEWPKKWLDSQSPLGWLQWYKKYHNGQRSEEDERQIRRWASFKARMLPIFKKNPTARRAFALRNWAIDPLRHVEGAAREDLRKEMEDLRSSAWDKWALEKSAMTHGDLEEIAAYLNMEHAASIPLDLNEQELETAIMSVIRGQSQGINPALAHLTEENISKMASGDREDAEVDALIEAKRLSDIRDFQSKRRIMTLLMHRHPENFHVDDPTPPKFWGVTHIPSGFKMHVDNVTIPAEVVTASHEKAAMVSDRLLRLFERRGEDIKGAVLRAAGGGREPSPEEVKAYWRAFREAVEEDDGTVIACDLDGTLAENYTGAFRKDVIGAPVPKMYQRVRAYLDAGHDVVLFTARAADKDNIPYIRKWLDERGLKEVTISNKKSPGMSAFWDDKAVAVEEDEGVSTHRKLADYHEDRIAARERTDRPDSKAQAHAGNYRKGKFFWKGLKIVFENPKGSTRSGTTEDGKSWSVVMRHDYGYIGGTKSKADGDAVDVFCGPDLDSELVFIVDQNKKDGSFDEHKCMIGFKSEEEARAAYASNFSTGWKGFRSITAVTLPDFKEWLNSNKTGDAYARGK